MLTQATFQTRARAIDHLGRGQIADTPTAVSELWKNAYDAYARDVSLHIFSGSLPIAGIYDNGSGMSAVDLQKKWLVVGTESKVDKRTGGEETFGLCPRVRLGEKGIGRLSAAFLSPVTLVVSKQVGHPYAALLVDWRFFENPYLLISDVHFPLVEFGGLDEFLPLLAQMVEDLKSNMDVGASADGARIRNAWEAFSLLEEEERPDVPTTEKQILALPEDLGLSWDHFLPWWRMLRKTSEQDLHGTALFCVDCNVDLASWVQASYESPDAQIAKDNMRETLINFTDPYTEQKNDFEYELITHQDDYEEVVLSSADAFTVEDFREFEHYFEGEFDATGAFTGRVKAYGIDRGSVTIPPPEFFPSSGKESVGPLTFHLATVEPDRRSSTLSDEAFASIQTKLEKYGGICLYRDGLRVQPYGRADGDLFELEERRSRNAGREFFSYRRCCGGIFISSQRNPNLRDKAGREGLVANKARRGFKRLIVNLLMTMARRYFGSSSEVRKEELPGIKKRNAAMAKAAEAARKRTQRDFKKKFKLIAPQAEEARDKAEKIRQQLVAAGESKDKPALLELRESIDKLDDLRDELRLPPRPGTSSIQEEQYRAYRDSYREFCTIIAAMKKTLAHFEVSGLLGDPRELAQKKMYSNEAKLSAVVSKQLRAMEKILETIQKHWIEIGEGDRKLYRKDVADLLEGLRVGEDPLNITNEFDVVYESLREDFEQKYGAVIGTLEQVAEDINLGEAFLAVDERNQKLEEKVTMLHAVAQLGITVEIIGHELEALESQVRRNLDAMPAQVQALTAFKMAREAHCALVDRLRFLSPLKKTSYRSKLDIHGAEIEDYVRQFFVRILENEHIEFSATETFRAVTIRDLPSRIYPTFINLVNNALYWVQQGARRIILLDYQQDKLIVADSGPGVDPDDLNELFQIFFTRRINGRGIGLYLCRENLSLAGYTIRYAGNDDPKILEGANFIIEKKGT